MASQQQQTKTPQKKFEDVPFQDAWTTEREACKMHGINENDAEISYSKHGKSAKDNVTLTWSIKDQGGYEYIHRGLVLKDKYTGKNKIYVSRTFEKKDYDRNLPIQFEEDVNLRQTLLDEFLTKYSA